MFGRLHVKATAAGILDGAGDLALNVVPRRPEEPGATQEGAGLGWILAQEAECLRGDRPRDLEAASWRRGHGAALGFDPSEEAGPRDLILARELRLGTRKGSGEECPEDLADTGAEGGLVTGPEAGEETSLHPAEDAGRIGGRRLG
jgi:hypothetical protein